MSVDREISRAADRALRDGRPATDPEVDALARRRARFFAGKLGLIVIATPLLVIISQILTLINGNSVFHPAFSVLLLAAAAGHMVFTVVMRRRAGRYLSDH